MLKADTYIMLKAKRLAGANCPDLQWATGGDNDLMKRVGLLCDSWNANCVRLCVH